MKTLIRLTAIIAAVVIQSLSSFASDIGGITNIHVNAFVPYTESFAGTSVGNVTRWLSMSEDGLAKKLYLEHRHRGDFAASNSVPDALFPSNTVAARVWRGHGEALTNAYNLLTADAAKAIIDPEVVNLLTNFSSLVKSVTRGVGSATIPYVDGEGNQQFGKAIVLGCTPGDWTAYNILTDEMKRIGDGYEDRPYPGVRRFVLTNSTVKIFGSRTPCVAYGPLGYTALCSSKDVNDVIEAVADEFIETGKTPFYDARRAAVVGSDAELRKIDPTYPRDFKTEGFTFFGYAYLSSKYQLTAAKMLEDYGFNPELAGTNTTFHYLATLCSEVRKDTNSRMRIDLQGSKAALRTIGASLRFTNLFLVNAGLLDEDFMTFDKDWTFDKELLEQIAAWAKDTREKLGLGGLHYWFDEGTNRVATHMNLALAPDGFLRRLFCADAAGKGEKNLCALFLPTNAVAAFTFQPEAAAWTELNRRLFSLVGQKSETLDQLFDVFAKHPNSFGKSASVCLLPGNEFVSAVKIEDENLWISLRILLEQFGGKTIVSPVYPEVTVIEFPYFHISYDRLYNVIKLSSGTEAGRAASLASRNWDARLINSPEFQKRMGIEESKGFPDRNALVYLAPACDTALHEKLEQVLDVLGLGTLKFILQHGDLSKTWLCGYGAYGEDGLFRTECYMSTNVWTQGHRLMKAAAKTFGQVMAAAYPYDASKARVFASGDMTLHVSRADNWDDVNGRLYPYEGDNIRLRIQLIGYDDWVGSGRLDADGYFSVEAGNSYFRGYLTSEGFFGDFDVLAQGYFIGRLAPEIEPELSVLPSAEEIAEEMKQVVEAIGVESVTVGAAQSNGKGPADEPAVIRETTVVPDSNGLLAKLLPLQDTTLKTPISAYMPSNTVFSAAIGLADGAITNVFAAIGSIQPDLVTWLKKILLGIGVDEALVGDSFNNAFACGFAQLGDGQEPYLVARLKEGKGQNWVALTNGLYHAEGVSVTKFQTSQTLGVWEGICFTFVDPVSQRPQSRCFTRVFESEDRDPVFIITSGDSFDTGLTAQVRWAGLYGVNRLRDDKTFQDCQIDQKSTDSKNRGWIYHAPTEDGLWFYDGLYVTDAGELVIKRRCPAAVAPIDMTALRFFVNFFEALTGEQSVIEFKKDADSDEYAKAITARVIQFIEKARQKQGVTGLDYYDSGLDADGRYGNSELAIGTTGDGCEFLKRFAADTPASEHLVETYIPATACALATKNAEAHYLTDDIGSGAKAVAELVGEKYPYVAAAITNYLASDSWKIITESLRLTGSHRAFAILQDFEKPFVKSIGGDNYAGISAGYAAVEVFGPMESALPFLLVKQAVADKPEWKSFTTNGVEYLIRDGQMFGLDIKSYVCPTFAFDPERKVLVLATLPRAAALAIRAGRDGENRLIDSETFADVMGFDPEAEMPVHNTLYYLAPQNDDILGCTLRRILGPYLPEGYAMLLDRPSLKGFWGGAYGTRVNDAFRLYIHAGMKGHTAALAAGQALLKTVAESMRVHQPYDWKESKVFRSADWIFRIDYTGESGKYARSNYLSDGEFYNAAIYETDSDNDAEFLGTKPMRIMSKSCIFASSTKGWSAVDAGRDAFHLLLIDEGTDPTDFKAGVALEVSMRELTLPAGEKVEKTLCIYPANAKITKVTGMPKGLSIKKTNEGYALVGTPTKVGEDCLVTVTAVCAGYETMTHTFHFMISNYESDYAELDAGYDLTAGVEDSLMLTNVIGWAASGVPSGMKFDKATGALSGTPAKPGEYVVTFTKKIDGATEKVSTVISVGQEDGIQIKTVFSDKTSGAPLTEGSPRGLYVGVKVNWPIEVTGLEGVETTLTAKGLPSGLKLVNVTDKLTGEVSYSIQGIATKASAIDKKTGEVKPSTVTLTGTNKYKWTGVETFELEVAALPDWAIGTFNGYHGSTLGEFHASTKVTASKTGKISVSISGVSSVSGNVTTDAFSVNGFDSYDAQNHCFAFSIENLKAKSGVEYRYSGAIGLDPSAIVTLGRYGASYQSGEKMAVEQANNHDWTFFVFPAGKSQLALDLTNDANPGLEGLTLKFANGGKVTVAGKVVDPETGKNVSVSASAQLVYHSEEDISGDGFFPASVGFVVKTATPFYAYVPVWLKRSGDTMVKVYETDPTKDE